MSTVDSRIVTMKFDNKQFQEGAAETLSTLDKLKQALSFSGSSKGLSDLQTNMGRANLNPLMASIESVNKGFLAMSAIAVTALAHITTAAFHAGTQLVSSLTVSPVQSGLKEYETNLNSIQTVLANTGLEGQEGLDKVNEALQTLNDYSDKTIYNFSEMARNIGTFTAAGVDLDTSVAAIKGIANLAAISGSNSHQASTAMYQLSQALATGTVRLMDWNSVVNAGMGGKVFQEALKETARVHGVAVDDIIRDQGSFRDSLAEGWLTSDILNETLMKFTGDLNAAQLKTMGYNEKQIEGILKMGKTATDAATKVKTASQLINTLQETATSGWAKTWQLILGDFGEAKKLFTAVNDTLGGIIASHAEARNKVLEDWKELGGRTVLIEGIRNVWKALLKIMRPIRNAFRDIFPAMTGERLFELTEQFRDFTKGLKISKDTMNDIRRTFRGVFAVFHIFTSILGGIIKYVFSFFGLLAGGGDSIFAFTGSIGDLLVKLDEWLTKGDKIGNFFDTLIDARAAVLEPLIDVIGSLIEAFGALITGGTPAFFAALEDTWGKLGTAGETIEAAMTAAFEAIGGAFDWLQSKLGGADSLLGGLFGGDELEKTKDDIGHIGDGISKVTGITGVLKNAWEGFLNAIKAVGDFLGPIFTAIGDAFGAVKDVVGNMFEGMGFQDALAVVNTGFFIAFYLMVSKFINTLDNLFSNADKIATNANKILDQVRSNLKTMQADVRANIILKIAAALALLAAAVYILSKIDAEDLAKSLTAVATMLALLTGALIVLEKNATVAGAARMTLVAGALLLLSVALLAMAGAVALFGQMDVATLAKGLGSVAVILILVTAMSAVLSKTGGGVQMVAVAAALLILAVGLTVLAGAILLYEKMDTGKLIEGMLKIIAVLIGLNVAMRGMTGSVGGAVAVAIVSASLIALATALQIMDSVEWASIAKAAVVLAALAISINAMTGAIAGAAALAITAASLVLIAAALVALNEVEWASIGKMSVALLALFTILGLAGLILGPVVPVIIVLAGALVLLGGAMLLAGAGMLLFATALATLAISGAVGFGVLIAGVIAFLEILPLLAQQVGLAMVAIAVVLGENAPILAEAIVKIIKAWLQSFREVVPELAKTFVLIIRTGLRVIRALTPEFVKTGFDILMAFLKGLRQNIDDIVDVGVDIIVKFLRGVRKKDDELADQAVKTIVSFIEACATAIENNKKDLNAAAGQLGEAIVSGMIDAMGQAAKSRVAAAAGALGGVGIAAINAVLNSRSPSKETYKIGGYFVDGFVFAIQDGTDAVEKSAKTMAETGLKAASDALNKMSDISTDLTVGLTLDTSSLDKARQSLSGSPLMVPVIVADRSLSQARSISAATESGAPTQFEGNGAPTEIKFEQNNYSPKALNPIEVYRNTKNQLALAKGALT